MLRSCDLSPIHIHQHKEASTASRARLRWPRLSRETPRIVDRRTSREHTFCAYQESYIWLRTCVRPSSIALTRMYRIRITQGKLIFPRDHPTSRGNWTVPRYIFNKTALRKQPASDRCMYGTSRTVGFFYHIRSFSLAPLCPSRSRFSISGSSKLPFGYARRNVQHHRLRVWQARCNFWWTLVREKREYSERSSLTTAGWSPRSRRELVLRSFSQCTAIRIFHENISDRDEDPRVTSETAIAHRYYDEIVNSSIFESACLQATCFMIYKAIFS